MSMDFTKSVLNLGLSIRETVDYTKEETRVEVALVRDDEKVFYISKVYASDEDVDVTEELEKISNEIHEVLMTDRLQQMLLNGSDTSRRAERA